MLNIIIKLLIASGLLKPTTDAIVTNLTKAVNGLTKVSEKHQKVHTRAQAAEAAAKNRASKAKDEIARAERVKGKLSNLLS